MRKNRSIWKQPMCYCSCRIKVARIGLPTTPRVPLLLVRMEKDIGVMLELGVNVDV